MTISLGGRHRAKTRRWLKMAVEIIVMQSYPGDAWGHQKLGEVRKDLPWGPVSAVMALVDTLTQDFWPREQ